ncbi:deleted in malignant brain tumors 1 protein-like [Corticium candelabrum]|uniref:deleted in malignant brain tumors 1 protein-like n=1 Tax=Corticium candelabrum TaxID=121492 RepID=UPI002E266249|nr:deleted in malignant brain tumors 1 protein-like [Corticium candelabrum]
MTCKLSMAYHMYGSQIGTLEVIAHTTYGNSSLWSRFGNQENQWLTTIVDFGSITGSFEIYLRASHSSGFKGDVALDDLSLTNCPPGSPLPPPTSFQPQPFPNTTCSFETNRCVWSNDVSNDVDWVMRQGGIASYQTGPTDDHTYHNGSELPTEYPTTDVITTSTPTAAKRFVDPCYAAASSIADGSVRLADGNTPNEGRVEIYHNGRWGTVCDDYWTSTNGRVVCKQLGYRYYLGRRYNRPGSGSIWMDNVRCSASDLRLRDCSFRGWGSHNCDHSDDVGVICGTASDGDVRLVNGYTANAGRVEIYHNGEWGGVCADGWDLNDANVVCKQLGYSRARTLSSHGQGCGRLWMSNINCQFGRYSRLDDCTFSGWDVRSCNHSGYADAICDLLSDATPAVLTEDNKSATPIIVGVTVSVISSLLVFVIILFVVIRVRRRQATTTTTTTTSAQVSSRRPPQAQSVIFVPSAYLNVTYPSLHFNSNELRAPPSYETAIGYRSDSQTVNFGEMNQQYVS